MKITDMHVDGFGVWNGLSVRDMSQPMTLFFGPNEAGKTTLMQFIRTALYGFSDERRRLYLPPVHGGEPGGTLRVATHSGEYSIERRVSQGEDANPAGRVVVLSESGRRQGQQLVDVLLSGVDESIFNNVFAVGIRELQELATLNDTQAAEHLYNLASGVDRVSLIEVMRDLETARRQVWNVPEHPSELGHLFLQQEKLVHELSELRQLSRRWADLAKQRIAVVDEVSQLEVAIARYERERRIAEIAGKVRDKWRTRVDTAKDRRTLGTVEPLPEGCLEKLDRLNQELAQQKGKLKPLDDRRRQIRRELAALPLNKQVWEQSCRIEAVCEHAPWIASLDGQIARLEKDLEGSETELLQQEDRLAGDAGLEFANLPLVSPRVLEQLQGPARVLSEAAQRRATARKRRERSTEAATASASQLKQELVGRRGDDFDEALQRAAELVKNLRRRVQVEDRLEQMWRHREELETEHHQLLDDQLSRIRVLGGVGLMYVFGFVLLLTGCFGWSVLPMSTEISWGVALLGLLCLFLSVAWKIVLERTERDEFETVVKRRHTLDSEITHTLTDQAELERILPAGTGPYGSRLATAERELKELEAMAPLQDDRRDAEKRSQIAVHRASNASSEFRDAKSRWRRALQHAGLPPTLTPKHIRRLAAHYQQTDQLRSRAQEQRQKLQQLGQERTALVERVQQLTQQVGLSTASDNAHVQLSQLSTLLNGQRDIVTRRQALKQEERGLRRTMATEGQTLRRLARSREALFAQARVADEAELRERAARLEQARLLDEKLQELHEQIQAIVGGFCPETEIEKELAEFDVAALKQRRDLLGSRSQEAQARLAHLHQRRGEINQEMKALSENKRLDAAQLELGVIREKIAVAVRRWQVLAAALRLLDEVRATYEAERQPETLGEASEYLHQLTEGRYRRIWTPLGTHVLRIDDNQGNCLPLDVLSRGTREAVFLSLRLALAAAYARRGINIPLVLDDVLVNLDKRRAEAAVRALDEFAHKGHQLLFFTCHDHMRDMFLEAGVEVRLLPSNQEFGAEARPIVLELPAPPPEPAVTAEPRAAEPPAAEPPAPEPPAPEPEELVPGLLEPEVPEPEAPEPVLLDDWDYRLREEEQELVWAHGDYVDADKLWWEHSPTV